MAARNETGLNPLHIAVANSNRNAVEELLSACLMGRTPKWGDLWDLILAPVTRPNAAPWPSVEKYVTRTPGCKQRELRRPPTAVSSDVIPALCSAAAGLPPVTAAAQQQRWILGGASAGMLESLLYGAESGGPDNSSAQPAQRLWVRHRELLHMAARLALPEAASVLLGVRGVRGYYVTGDSLDVVRLLPLPLPLPLRERLRIPWAGDCWGASTRLMCARARAPSSPLTAPRCARSTSTVWL